MQNDEAVRSLLRLEEAHSVLANSFATTFIVGFMILVSAVVFALAAHGWRRYGADRLDKAFAVVSGCALVVGVLALPQVVGADMEARREAHAALADDALCARILRDVSKGDLRYMERASAWAVSEECGRERFLVAANSPRSVLSADAMGLR